MKLLIVDDEEKIRNGIKHFISMNDFAIETILMAISGTDALEIIGNYDPDIIISDVVMPGISGLEFAQKAIAQLPEVKIIMISGHADLEYFKSAFQIDAVDYILKPIDLPEFARVLRKTIESCEKARREKNEKESLIKLLDESKSILLDKFYCDLVEGKFADHDEIRQKLEFFRLDFNMEQAFASVTIKIFDNASLEEGKSEEYSKNMKKIAILQKVRQLLSTLYSSVCCIKEDDSIAALLSIRRIDTKDFKKTIEKRCSDLCVDIKAGFNTVVCIGIGNVADDISLINTSYRQSLEAIKQSFFFGKGQLFFYSDFCSESVVEFSFEYDFKQKLIDLIYENDRQAIVEQINKNVRHFTEQKSTTAEMILSLKLDIATMIIDLLKRFAVPEGEKNIHKKLIGEMMKVDTLKEIALFMQEKVISICSEFQNSRKKRAIKIVDTVKSIVEKELRTGINVQGIAYKINISPNYLSAVFKNETGINLTEYITSERMNKAAFLLLNSICKVGEIAATVGCEDQNYFTKIFRKQFGVNPTEYRENGK